jgi:hypothetical protein
MENVPAQQTTAFNRIDQAAERARLRFITGGIGQALVYQEKAEQASDYVAAGYPSDLLSYPYLQAEVNATGKSSKDIAKGILHQRSIWIRTGASIEEARLRGKEAVRAATTEEGVKEALQACVAALDAI